MLHIYIYIYIYDISSLRVNTVVVLGIKKGYSSTVVTGYLKLGPVWVKSTNLILDCVEKKIFQRNKLAASECIMTSVNLCELGNRT